LERLLTAVLGWMSVAIQTPATSGLKPWSFIGGCDTAEAVPSHGPSLNQQ